MIQCEQSGEKKRKSEKKIVYARKKIKNKITNKRESLNPSACVVQGERPFGISRAPLFASFFIASAQWRWRKKKKPPSWVMESRPSNSVIGSEDSRWILEIVRNNTHTQRRIAKALMSINKEREIIFDRANLPLFARYVFLTITTYYESSLADVK